MAKLSIEDQFLCFSVMRKYIIPCYKLTINQMHFYEMKTTFLNDESKHIFK